MNDGQSVEAYLDRKAREIEKGYNGNGGGTPLAMFASMWPAATAGDGEKGAIHYRRRGKDVPGLALAADQWPAPTASTKGPDFAKVERSTEGEGLSLETTVSMWPAPIASDHRSIYASDETMDSNPRPLREVVGKWRAPTAGDSERGTNGTWEPDAKAGEHSLRHQIEKWQSPGTDSFRSRGGDRKDEEGLDQQAANWMSPRVSTGTYTKDRGKGPERPTLEGQAMLWPTARVNGGYGNGERASDSTNSRLEDTAAAFPSSPQDQPISIPGEPSSNERRSLNPLFVGWLMGWPIGWTSFECSATGRFLWSARMRYELWRLGLPAEAPKAQLSLFG